MSANKLLFFVVVAGCLSVIVKLYLHVLKK